jgi:hypothetical protein
LLGRRHEEEEKEDDREEGADVDAGGYSTVRG